MEVKVNKDNDKKFMSGLQSQEPSLFDPHTPEVMEEAQKNKSLMENDHSSGGLEYFTE